MVWYNGRNKRKLEKKDLINEPLHSWLAYFDEQTEESIVEEVLSMDVAIQKTNSGEIKREDDSPMSEKKLENILKNAKTSMEIEGFIVDKELEETGRKILKGEINIKDYITQVKREAMRYANEV